MHREKETTLLQTTTAAVEETDDDYEVTGAPSIDETPDTVDTTDETVTVRCLCLYSQMPLS